MRPEEDRSPSDELYAEGGEALVALVVPDLLNNLVLPFADGMERESWSDVEDPARASRRASPTAWAVLISDLDGTQP